MRHLNPVPRGASRPVSRLTARLVAALLASSVAALSGCGAPGYRFYTNGTNELVLKVPRSWTQVKAGVPVGSDGQPRPKGTWVAMYDASARPSTQHVQSLHADEPAVYVVSAAIPKDEGATLTDDDLRNQLLPVTPPARQIAALQGFTASHFALISDQPFRTRTARGVHVVVTYDAGHGPEIYDKVAVTDARKTRVHLLLVHCTKTCYDANRQAIAEMLRSFTVKLG